MARRHWPQALGTFMFLFAYLCFDVSRVCAREHVCKIRQIPKALDQCGLYIHTLWLLFAAGCAPYTMVLFCCGVNCGASGVGMDPAQPGILRSQWERIH